jgi:putative ATP-binding cassette transporter
MKLILFLLRCSRDIKHSRIGIGIVVAAGFVAGAVNAGLLALINTLLNDPEGATSGLLWGFILFCLIMLASRVVSGVLLNSLSQAAMFNLCMKLSRKILNAPLRQLEELGAPRLLASLTGDVPVIANTITLIPVLCMQIAILGGCLIYLAWLSWKVLLLVLGFMAFGVVSYQIPMLTALRYLRLAREDRDVMFKHFRALTEGVKELKLNYARRHAFLSENLETSAASFRRNNLLGNNIFTVAASWGHLLVFVLVGLLFFALPAFHPVDARVITGYTIIILYMMTPLEIVLNSLPELGQANVAAQKIEALGLSLETDSTEAESAPLPEPSWGCLELVGVTHAYRGGQENGSFKLGPVDLCLRPGELVFITGGNGSGKTTLAKLLVGLYAPEAGEIRLKGNPVTDETREYYRQHFSAVFSDFYLFESLLGMREPELDSMARDYLAQLQLDRKVEINAGVLSTIELSQGQRKRLALLTAYLEDRSIYLFDEWAADQEPLFREIFYSELLPRLKARGKLVIVISHDDRYYHVGDRIIKLDYGRIDYDSRSDGRASKA